MAVEAGPGIVVGVCLSGLYDASALLRLTLPWGLSNRSFGCADVNPVADGRSSTGRSD